MFISILSVSILLQLIAAILAVRLIYITGRQLAWTMIASAVLLMTIRRIVTLFEQIVGESPSTSGGDISAELVALLISILMLAGIASIRPVFISLKNSKQKIKESEDNFLALAQNSSDGIFVSVDDDLVFANHETAKILGYSHVELLNIDIRNIFEPVTYDRLCVADSDRLQDISNPNIFETNFRKKNREAFPVEVSAANTTWNNSPARIISFRDITQRKQDEMALRASKKMLRLVLDTIPVRVFWKTPESKYLGCNQLFAEDAGFTSPDQIIGKQDNEMGWREQAELYRSDDAAVIRSGVPKLNYEEPQTATDGSLRWLRTSKIPLKDDKNNIIGVLGCYEDVTEHKKIEDELKHYRETLEDQVKERTRELELINRELESFSYSVSHDLRAPLRGINGFSNILLEDYSDQLDEAGKNYLCRIRANTIHMDELIDDLLILSRVSRSEMRKEHVNLSKLAYKIKARLEEESERDVEFIIQDDLTDECDAHLVEIVIENLIGNAWKYSAKQNKSCIEFGLTQKNNTHFYYVRDNGVGFDMAYVNKIFDAFERLHKPSEFEGTGIGLATVRRIIQRHGGEVWAESEINKGSTFYFSLGNKA